MSREQTLADIFKGYTQCISCKQPLVCIEFESKTNSEQFEGEARHEYEMACENPKCQCYSMVIKNELTMYPTGEAVDFNCPIGEVEVPVPNLETNFTTKKPQVH